MRPNPSLKRRGPTAGAAGRRWFILRAAAPAVGPALARTLGRTKPTWAALERLLYAIKAEIRNPSATAFDFPDQKTMYSGKKIAAGDTVYIFASENEGGSSLVGRGVVEQATNTPRRPEIERQTPRVSMKIIHVVRAKRSLGRTELKPYDNWNDRKPESELKFKLYRQATNKSSASLWKQQRLSKGIFKHFHRRALRVRPNPSVKRRPATAATAWPLQAIV